jgi:hypothetical protein
MFDHSIDFFAQEIYPLIETPGLINVLKYAIRL